MQRIVVIDDEPGIRRTLEAVLTRAGYEVRLASNGSEGVALCRDSVPHLVITDLHMPQADGFEAIVALRALDPKLPIIAISGGDETARLQLLGSSELLGVVSSLKKPFTVREILDAVRAAIGSHRQGKEA